ncbi:MAG: hypothetical protein KatS3mg105_1926 [Gemmatales bacterium]|nr:MAG: hypothetical protein KatS3mg105_1926 [Gemmatales bacterium]
MTDIVLGEHAENGFQGGRDEDKGNESGKHFVCEPGEIAHQATGIPAGEQNQEQGCPDADPGPAGQKIDIHVYADLIKEGSKDELWSGASENNQRLTGEQGVQHAAEGRRQDHFHGADLIAGQVRCHPPRT